MSTPAITLSDTAVRKVGELLHVKGDDSLLLRVYIEGGGCSGFQYGFAFEPDSEDGDMVLTVDDVKVVVDPMSYQYLSGSVVDYKEDLQGSRFVIDNPNAQTTCGCGASFSV